MSVIIGLTGGIACGKSTAAQQFAKRGFAVLDTDDVAHDCMAQGEPGYRNIVEHFGSDILQESGEIDRKKLGERVFGHPEELQHLNGILHPRVSRRWRDWRTKMRREGRKACIVIPLLYEVGATDGWDAIVVIRASEETVLGRLAKRGLSEESSRQRISAQLSIEEKVKRADIVIDNDGSLKEFEQNIQRVIVQLTSGRK